MTSLYAKDVNVLNKEVFNLIKLLPGIVVLLNKDKEIIYFSTDAALHALIRDGNLSVDELVKFVHSLKSDFFQANTQINHQSPNSATSQKLEVDALQIDNHHILLLLSDLTSSLRIEQIRRDFIANISHELKTPVSALELLSEAIKE